MGGTGIGCSDDQADRGGWFWRRGWPDAGLLAGKDCETGGKRVYWKANKANRIKNIKRRKQERGCI